MKKLKKELIRFFFAGVSAVLTDFIIYSLLLNFLDTNSSKFISFICGTLVAFLINKFWTFESYMKKMDEIIKFIILYSFSLIINVLVNDFFINYTGLIVVAFTFATVTSATINFIGQKFWVFK